MSCSPAPHAEVPNPSHFLATKPQSQLDRSFAHDEIAVPIWHGVAIQPNVGCQRPGGGTSDFTSDDPALRLRGTVQTGPTALKLSRGVAARSSTCRRSGQCVRLPVTDRGPNIDCSEAEELVGADFNKMRAGDGSAKIFPQPDFVPSIQRLELGTLDGAFGEGSDPGPADAAGKPDHGPCPIR